MQLRRWVSPGVVIYAALAVTALVCGTGCGGGGGYSGPVGTVTGSIKLGGKPVPDGTSVTFIGDAGHTASGKVSGGGSYQLSTIANDSKSDAIPVGKYRVCVTSPSTAQTMTDAEYDKMMTESASGGAAAKAPPSAIPAKYQTTTTSQLSFEIKEGPNTIDIELK